MRENLVKNMVEIDQSFLAIIIASGTAIVVAVGVIAQWLNFNENKNLRFSEIIRDFKLDLQNTYPDKDIDDFYAFKKFSTFFLNTLDRLVYLRNLNKIDDKVMDFFEWDLRFALNLRDIEKDWKEHDITKDWEKTFQWCQKRKLKLVPSHEIPDAVLQIMDKDLQAKLKQM